jgi:hypothetical protein
VFKVEDSKMTRSEEIKKIQKLPYKIASIDQKMDMIKSVIADDNSLYKWWIPMQFFQDTRLRELVATENVRHQLSFHFNTLDMTWSCKADFVQSMVNGYADIIDVDPIVREVFGDQYPALMEQISQHKVEREEFHERLKTVSENSTMDDILAVFSQVKEDLKKN